MKVGNFLMSNDGETALSRGDVILAGTPNLHFGGLGACDRLFRAPAARPWSVPSRRRRRQIRCPYLTVPVVVLERDDNESPALIDD
jgi:hypothetical protein